MRRKSVTFLCQLEQAGLALAQEAAEELEEVYAPSAGGYAQVRTQETVAGGLSCIDPEVPPVSRAALFFPIALPYAPCKRS
jgi:hypothetical protein